MKEAKIRLAALVLLGTGERKRAMDHAEATGKLLSAIDPDFASALTLMLIPGTPLYEEVDEEILKSGAWLIVDCFIRNVLFFLNCGPNNQ